MNNILLTEGNPRRDVSSVSSFCILVLFILRVPMLGFLSLFFTRTENLYSIFVIGTYAFTAVFIWIERERLEDYHMDKISIFIFTIGPLWFMWNNLLLRVPMMIIGISLLTGLFLTKTKLKKITIQNMKWLLIGLLIGALTAIITSYFLSKQVTNSGTKASVTLLIKLFLTQLTNAAIYEEPFFRGCLWGFLKKIKCNEVVIYFIQAGLFWLGHIYYFCKEPYSFFIGVPLSALVLGLLAWRSRSISTSMVAHGMINGLGQLIMFYKIF